MEFYETIMFVIAVCLLASFALWFGYKRHKRIGIRYYEFRPCKKENTGIKKKVKPCSCFAETELDGQTVSFPISEKVFEDIEKNKEMEVTIWQAAEPCLLYAKGKPYEVFFGEISDEQIEKRRMKQYLIVGGIAAFIISLILIVIKINS